MPSFPPSGILNAALKTIHCAAYTTRNWALDDTVPRQQILDLWEAVHDIPDLLTRWEGETSEKLLFLYFAEYSSKWDYPNLRERYQAHLE